MNGLIALVGSGEYLPVMEDTDRYLLGSLNVNGRKPRVVCLPTAAGQEGDESVNRWSRMGIEHFQKLGADVTAVKIINKETANDMQYESVLENADFIYFSGGNPQYLHDTMQDTCAWKAMQRAWTRGAIYAGCSAGAMILAKRIPSFRLFNTVEGFGVVPAQYVFPHFDAVPVMFKPLISALTSKLKKDERMIGVDEDTALVGKLGGEWKVMGKSQVHLFTPKGKTTYDSGQTITLD
ncbi:MAG: Type 1 glutamine amidotransferase-like domain-containing protein [Anaerolineales bacterium]